MDLCTYDSLMIVKVANLSLYHNKEADLASFLGVAVQMLAARVRSPSFARYRASLMRVQMLCVGIGTKFAQRPAASPVPIFDLADATAFPMSPVKKP